VLGKAAAARARSPSGTGEPPITSVRNEVTSNRPGSASRASRTRVTMVGTAAHAVIRSRSRISSIRSASKRPSRNTSVLPDTMAVRSCWMPPMWNSGMVMSVTLAGRSSRSPGSRRATASRFCRLASTLPCVSVAPLGKLVVPEVNRIIAGSSSAARAGGGPSPAESQSSNVARWRQGSEAGRRPRRRSSATASRAPVVWTAWAASSAFHQALAGMRTQSLARQAQNTTTQARLLAPNSTMRSPGAAPSARRRFPTSRTAAPTSAKVMRRSPCTRWTLSPWRADASTSWARCVGRRAKTRHGSPSTFPSTTSDPHCVR
jgi:hypothetical protein